MSCTWVLLHTCHEINNDREKHDWNYAQRNKVEDHFRHEIRRRAIESVAPLMPVQNKMKIKHTEFYYVGVHVHDCGTIK